MTLREDAVANYVWRQLNEGVSFDMIDKFSGVEFETFLKQLFVKMGYSARTTVTTGDQGADLILTGGEDKYRTAVQAKRSAGVVGNRAIQEVLGAMVYYKCSRGIVVTNSMFTASAVKLAEKDRRLALWDGSKLRELIREHISGIPRPFDRQQYNELIERLRARSKSKSDPSTRPIGFSRLF